MLMPVYTAKWIAKVAMKDQQQVESNYARLARLLRSTAKARQPEDRSRPGIPTLKRLVRALGYT